MSINVGNTLNHVANVATSFFKLGQAAANAEQSVRQAGVTQKNDATGDCARDKGSVLTSTVTPSNQAPVAAPVFSAPAQTYTQASTYAPQQLPMPTYVPVSTLPPQAPTSGSTNNYSVGGYPNLSDPSFGTPYQPVVQTQPAVQGQGLLPSLLNVFNMLGGQNSAQTQSAGQPTDCFGQIQQSTAGQGYNATNVLNPGDWLGANQNSIGGQELHHPSRFNPVQNLLHNVIGSTINLFRAAFPASFGAPATGSPNGGVPGQTTGTVGRSGLDFGDQRTFPVVGGVVSDLATNAKKYAETTSNKDQQKDLKELSSVSEKLNSLLEGFGKKWLSGSLFDGLLKKSTSV